ncbi:hypothetical protein JWZ98_11250 [Methylomonas sp. EFPC1]|uniref:hypothetical protein n=1 Tax=Methylomonas sp. EFPC1 TaxID=2812647 RepID=UPI00196719E4|nr:hypothetical protein [Methylomonas sp. EFPC1]QSB03453.1 hypothetical protein JWZ98_11250 [Methylomonas sp. EFPC1]
MPKVYVRVNPRSQISKRHRCAIEFTQTWKELEDIDAATRAALEEDPYLEVSETPTVLVEVAAAVQTAAPEASGNPIQPTESTAQQNSADAAQGDSEQVGTASAADGQATEINDVKDSGLNGVINDPSDSTSDAPEVTSGADAGKIPGSQQETQAIQDEAGAELSAAKTTQASVAEAGVDTRLETIKAAIAQLDPNNAEHWLSDGKPVIDAVSALAGFKVLAAERDQAWNQVKTQAVAG